MNHGKFTQQLRDDSSAASKVIIAELDRALHDHYAKGLCYRIDLCTKQLKIIYMEGPYVWDIYIISHAFYSTWNHLGCT